MKSMKLGVWVLVGMGLAMLLSVGGNAPLSGVFGLRGEPKRSG